jgi:hypothetical protein
MTDDAKLSAFLKSLAHAHDGGAFERAKRRVAEGRAIENSTDTGRSPMTDIDMSALWREDVTHEEHVALYQHLVDTGQAWRLEGHVGRTADALLEAGVIMLGEEGHNDYYGNYVPSRHEVEPGTKGSAEYVTARQEDFDA